MCVSSMFSQVLSTCSLPVVVIVVLLIYVLVASAGHAFNKVIQSFCGHTDSAS